MSGPFAEESQEESEERRKDMVILPEKACPTGITL